MYEVVVAMFVIVPLSFTLDLLDYYALTFCISSLETALFLVAPEVFD